MAKQATTLEDTITQERERLTAAVEEVNNRRKLLDEEAAELERQLTAITAYFDARSGKLPTAPKTRTPSTAPRAPRGSRREGLIEIIKQNPDGINRADILDKLGAKGNKSAEQSISNALATLKKKGTIGQNDGKYVAA